MKLLALLVTLIAGCSFLLGVLIIKFSKHKSKITEFSISLAFSVIVCLLFFDIFPEIYEQYVSIYAFLTYTLGFILIGIIILVVLDELIPAHHHDHHDREKNLEEHNLHMYHVGLISSIAIILHNVIEGLSIYTICATNIISGIILALGVSLHNIPMGMEISVFLDNAKKSSKFKIIAYLCICLSTLVGGIIGLMFNNISSTILAMALGITAGMLIYIAFFELAKKVFSNIKSRYTFLGLIIGILLMSLTLIF